MLPLTALGLAVGLALGPPPTGAAPVVEDLVPTGGSDTSDGTFNVANVVSDNAVYDNYTATTGDFNNTRYQEYLYTPPAFPAGSYIGQALVTIDFDERNLGDVHIRVWKASESRWQTYVVDVASTEGVEIHKEIDLSALLDNPADVAATKVRFFAWRRSATATSRVDFVPLSYVYDIDLTAPTVSFTSPLDGSTHITPLPLAVTAADTGGAGIERTDIEWAPAGSGTWTLLDCFYTTSYTGSWQPPADGLYDLRATTYDRAGNQVSDSVLAVRYDGPPSITNLAPAANASSSVGTPLIAFDALDALDGVDPLSLRLLVQGVDVTALATVTPIAGGYHVEYAPPAGFPWGSYVAVSAAASDNGGLNVVRPWIFYIDQKYYPGDIVINMNHADNTAQQVYDAYGLVLRAASSGTDVDWVIDQAKAYGGVDVNFVVDNAPNSATPGPDGTVAAKDYLSGPFVIRDPDRSTAYNEAWDVLLPIVSSFTYTINFDEIQAEKQVSRRNVFFVTYMPRIAAGDNLSNLETNLAKIPYTQVTAPGTVAGSTTVAGGALFDAAIDPFCGRIRKYDIIITGHYDWNAPDANETTAIAEMDEFIAKAGMGIYTCLATTLENVTHWLTLPTNVLVEGIDTTGNHAPDLRRLGHPFLQTLGTLPVETGAFELWAQNSNQFTPNIQNILVDPNNGDIGYNFGAVGSGKAYYMGGHTRGTLATRRLMYNAFLYNVVYPKYTRAFDPGRVPAGEPTEVTVTIQTTGGSMSIDNVVSDLLDTVSTYVPGSAVLYVPGSTVTYDATARRLDFHFGDFNPYDYPGGVIAEYRVNVLAPTEGIIRVVDHTNSYTDDWDARYTFQATGCAAVRVVPGLVATKSSSRSAIPTGQTTRLTLSIVVGNSLAQAPTTQVVLTDTLPPGVVFVPGTIVTSIGTADYGVTTPGVLTWDIGTLEPAQSALLTFEVDVTAGPIGTMLVNDGAGVTALSSTGLPISITSNDVNVAVVGTSSPVLDFSLTPTDTGTGLATAFTYCVSNIGGTGTMTQNVDAITLQIPAEFGDPTNIVTPVLPTPTWTWFWDAARRELRFTYNPNLTWTGGDSYCFNFDLTPSAPGVFLFPAAASLSSNALQFDENLPVTVTSFAGVTLLSDRLQGAEPCETTAFPLQATNTGTLPDVLDLSVSSALGWSWSFYLDIDLSGTLSAGDVPATDTDADGVPDTGTLLTGTSAALLAVVTVPTPGGIDEVGTVVATSSRDLTQFASARLTVQSVAMVVDITKGPDGLCPGAAVNLDATPGFAGYSWSTGETTPSIVVTPIASSIYFLTVTNRFGCNAFDSVLVTVQAPPLADAGPDTGACVGAPQTIGTPAVPGYSYLWSPPGEFADPTLAVQTFVPAASGTYTLQVTDNFSGCTATDTVEVAVGNPPAADAGPDVEACAGIAQTIGTPAVAGFSYRWSPAADFADPTLAVQTFVPPASGTYTLEVTEIATGCRATDTVNVTVLSGVPLPPMGNVYKLAKRLPDAVLHTWIDVPGASENSITNDFVKSRPTPAPVSIVPVGPQSFLESGNLRDGQLHFYQVEPSGCR